MREEVVASTYFITINSNIPHTDAYKEKYQTFQRAVRKLFLSSNILNFITILDDQDKSKSVKELIQSVNIKLDAEVGDKQHRLHYHGTCEILHYTTLEIHFHKILTYFIQQTKVKPALNLRLNKTNGQGVLMLRYAQKNSKKRRPLEVVSSIAEQDGRIRKYTN